MTTTTGDQIFQDSVSIEKNLSVGGQAQLGSLTVTSDAFAATLSTPNRMHISGGELLYLLNKDGVVIGKEWGGNGNLFIEGSLIVNQVRLLTNNTPGSWNPLTQQGDHLLLWTGAAIDNPGAGLVIAPWRSSTSGIRIDSNGNVGIGTATPQSKLAVSDLSAGTSVQVDGNNGQYGFYLGADSNHPWIGSRTNHDLRIVTNSTEKVRVTANGNVGIGTSPHQNFKLDVNGNLKVGSGLFVSGSVGIGTVGGFLARLTIEESSHFMLAFRDTNCAVNEGGLWRMPIANGVLRFDVNTDPDPDHVFRNYLAPLAMTKEGNVGIGTTNPDPSFKLDVNGSLKVTGDIHFGATLSTPGRMHISGGELLYLLNKDGVVIGKGWGGNGNLFIEGSLIVNQVRLLTNNTPGSWNPLTQQGDHLLLWTGAAIDNPGAGLVIAPWRSSASGIRIDANGNVSFGTTIRLDAQAGDIILENADCAEDFDIVATEVIDPGTVVVIHDDGKLGTSTQAYDKRVAGVVSGAGECRPGIVLGKQPGTVNRQSIALIGKVYCKVDADFAAIEVGDLLTTSPTPGHAMKAQDPLKTSGSIIGKALEPLRSGQGMIPILVALQ